MNASIALPPEYSNTIYLFICFLVFFWLFKAVKRFYRSLVLRYAATHDSIVQIQGLGSYLSYFDGATSGHLHSIVHTRQTKPPVEMNMMMVPCSLLKAKLISDTHELSILEIQFNAIVPGKLMLLSNFNMAKFRSAVASGQQRKKTTTHFFSDASHSHNVSFRDSLFSVDQQILSSTSDTRKCQLSFLSEQEVCDRSCVKYDCTTGTHTVQFAFANPHPTAVVSPSTSSSITEPAEGKEEEKTGSGRRRSRSSSTSNRRRNRSELFTLAVVFLPNTTDHVPRVQHSGDLIRDRDSVDRESKGTSKPSPSKSTVIFDSADSGKDSVNSAQNTSGFLNFRNYFSLGSIDNHRSTASTKRLIVPLESPVTSTDAGTSGDQKRGDYHHYSAPSDPQDLSAAVIASGRKSEVSAVSIFTFQFPSNLLSLFRDDGAAASTNPVIERSNSNPRRRSHAPKQSATSSSSAVAASSTLPQRSKEVLPKDLTIMDKNGRLFNSLEIFGLASLNEGGSNVTVGPPLIPNPAGESTGEKVSAITAPTLTTDGIALGATASGINRSSSASSVRMGQAGGTASTERDLETGEPSANQTSPESIPITPSTSAIFQGGKFVREDCVVCLTDPKNVVLLPCRHLCVCSSCLVYVDKCPVCRAFFEEYVVIRTSDQNNPTTAINNGDTTNNNNPTSDSNTSTTDVANR